MHSLVALKLGKTAARTACGTSSIQGRRASQEDRFFACESLPELPECGLYAVYDGHGGDRAASFATSSMQEKLVATPAFKSHDLCLALEQVAEIEPRSIRDAAETRTAAAARIESFTTAHRYVAGVPRGGDGLPAHSEPRGPARRDHRGRRAR